MGDENEIDYDLIHAAVSAVSACAAKYKVLSEHWIHGFDDDYDESESYCYGCAEKRIAELVKESPNNEYRIGGGYRSEGDSQAFCEMCEAPLDNAFTTHAAEQELDHFEEYGFDPTSANDCYSFLQLCRATGCGDSEINKRIQSLAEKIIAANQEAQ